MMGGTFFISAAESIFSKKLVEHPKVNNAVPKLAACGGYLWCCVVLYAESAHCVHLGYYVSWNGYPCELYCEVGEDQPFISPRSVSN